MQSPANLSKLGGYVGILWLILALNFKQAICCLHGKITPCDL